MSPSQLGRKLGQQIFVDNRGGAGGVVGTDVAAKSTPDGYTLLVISVAHAVDPWLYKLTFDPVKDFVPVGILGTGTNVLTVNPKTPIHSVKELLDLAKAEAGLPELRLRRHRQLPKSQRRTVQADGRRRYRARAV